MRPLGPMVSKIAMSAVLVVSTFVVTMEGSTARATDRPFPTNASPTALQNPSEPDPDFSVDLVRVASKKGSDPHVPSRKSDDPRRHRVAGGGDWIDGGRSAILVRLPREFLDIPNLREKIRILDDTCRVVFGWQREPEPLIAIDCSGPVDDLKLKVTGFAPIALRSDAVPEQIRPDELISTRDLRLISRSARGASTQTIGIRMDWSGLISGTREFVDPGSGVSCGLDRPVTFADLVDREEPIERTLECATSKFIGTLPASAKIEGCANRDVRESSTCRLSSASDGRARIVFGGLFSPLELRAGGEQVDVGTRTPKLDGFDGNDMTFKFPGYGSARYRVTDARYCTSSACCPRAASGVDGGRRLASFTPNEAECGDMAPLIERLTVKAELVDAGDQIKGALKPQLNLDLPVDRPSSATLDTVADLLSAESYGVPLPETGLVARPRLLLYASLDDCRKSDRSTPVVGSMSVTPEGRDAAATGRLSGAIESRAPLHLLFGRLFDSTRAISSCAQAVPVAATDPAHGHGVLYKFPVVLNNEFSSRSLFVISTSGRFIADGNASAVLSVLDTWLKSVKEGANPPYFEIIEITDSGTTRRILDSDQLTTMAVQGGAGSLREILDGLAFVGSARHALGDFRLVAQNHGGSRIDRVVYLVDSTAETFNPAEIGTVYDLAGRKNVQFHVVSLSGCRGWRELIPGNKNLICTELTSNSANTKKILKTELDFLVNQKPEN